MASPVGTSGALDGPEIRTAFSPPPGAIRVGASFPPLRPPAAVARPAVRRIGRPTSPRARTGPAAVGSGVTPAAGPGPVETGRCGARRPKFDRLTRPEVRAGLQDETATIGTRAGWADRLRERGYALRGHRLARCRSERGS
jgi:hypothetical protein